MHILDLDYSFSRTLRPLLPCFILTWLAGDKTNIPDITQSQSLPCWQIVHLDDEQRCSYASIPEGLVLYHNRCELDLVEGSGGIPLSTFKSFGNNGLPHHRRRQRVWALVGFFSEWFWNWMMLFIGMKLLGEQIYCVFSWNSGNTHFYDPFSS